MSFRDRLRQAMERKGLDQKGLAVAAGVSESAVSRHLDREDAPRADSLKKYADALGVSVAWLGYGRAETPLPASGTVASPSVDPGVGLVGPAALAYVLRDYVWPVDVDMATIDAAEAEARSSALMPAGQSRSPSAWRACLDRLVRQRPGLRSVKR